MTNEKVRELMKKYDNNRNNKILNEILEKKFYSHFVLCNDDKIVHASHKYKKYIGDEVTETAITITGYNLVSAAEVKITIDEENNKITFLYEKKTDLSYKVNYLEEGTDKVLSPSKEVTGQTYLSKVTENAIEINGYDKVFPTEVTITVEVENNEINFYYTKKEYNYIVEYYFDDIKDDSKTEIISAPYLSQITTYPNKKQENYIVDYVVGLPLIVDFLEENNVIKVYYAIDKLYDSDMTDDIYDIDGFGSDNIPDKYQKKVVFNVVNGQWKDGTCDAIIDIITFRKDDQNDFNVNGKVNVPEDMIPLIGYEGGAWDKEPNEIVSDLNEEEYTYTFELIINNPKTGDNIIIWVWLMIISITNLFVLTLFYKKRI